MSAREGTHAASAMGKPTMDAYASWQGDKGWRRVGDGESWTAGIVLNVPIFDGFRARSEVARAKARERVAAENLRRTELTLQMELERARLAYDLAREQKGVAEKQVSQAEEAARLSREKFSVGTLLSTELMGVENRLTDSRVQLAVATSQEYIALAHLRRVSGLPILENIK